ncbi:GtrA family protein [Streptomyces sp. LN549]|uniref:GtrA family protein n=1 Tax=Streptomyces sp. LN549 TaxID=3112979 RepID=UPI0037161185
MTAPSLQPTRTLHPALAAFVRFVICGGGVGVASSGVLVLLQDRMPLAVANALVTVVSTVIATELHSRVSFRSGRRGWGVHLQSGLTVAVSYAFTTGALFCLYAVQSEPSALVQQSVYLSASAIAGAGRFALLRVVVFGERKVDRTREAPLGKVSVAMAA